MITLELAINIIIILLLIPAIYYAANLSRNLTKLDQNQQKMMELAQALKQAVDTFDNKSIASENSTAPANEKSKEEQISVSETKEDISFNELQPLTPEINTEPQKAENKTIASTFDNEPPSEAELELLQALRSIK